MDFIQQGEEVEILARLWVVKMANIHVQGTGEPAGFTAPGTSVDERILSEFAYKHSHLTQVQGSQGWILAINRPAYF